MPGQYLDPVERARKDLGRLPRKTSDNAVERTERTIVQQQQEQNLKALKLKAKQKVSRYQTMGGPQNDRIANSPEPSEFIPYDETHRTRFTTVTAAHGAGDSRKQRIIENMAEVKFRGTLSKSKLDKTLEYNISSPLKNNNFES